MLHTYAAKHEEQTARKTHGFMDFYTSTFGIYNTEQVHFISWAKIVPWNEYISNKPILMMIYTIALKVVEPGL